MARTFLNSDKREFWRDISRIRGSTKRVATTVEGRTEKHDIAERFSQHYRVLFNSVHYDEREMSQLYHDVCSETSDCKDHGHCISSDSVHEALKLMKRGKSDGYDGLTSDYLKMVPSC